MTKKTIRCAIYTRKSTDEGLEQDFNSLDAQHEACTAYVASQKHEGWKLVKTRYDDAAISGGTLERPGLQTLLGDIDQGLVDMIVVYKIDRLTRSLSGFAKIVDRLEAKSASFVSVTQSFNTATSMGRLTLNMLLSFAQFEREVTAERIRDKIAASRAKGMWMGGSVPLGYDLNPDQRERGIVINLTEANTVRFLFESYERLPNMRILQQEAERLGYRSKQHTGKTTGGIIMGKGHIHYILTNPVYAGKVRHKGKVYEGQQEAIVDEALWQRVQAKLQERSARKRGQGSDGSHFAWLKGKLADETGDVLTPSHAKKGERLFRYYISNRLTRRKDTSAWRLSASSLEQSLEACIKEHLRAKAGSYALFDTQTASRLPALQEHLMAWLTRLKDGGLPAKRDLALILKSARLGKNCIHIELDHDSLAEFSGISVPELDEEALIFTAPFTIRRRKAECKIVVGEFHRSADTKLVSTLKRSHRWVADLKQGQSLQSLAEGEKLSLNCIRKQLKLAHLAPRIQQTILSETYPEDWTVAYFTKPQLLLGWHEQEVKSGLT